MLKRSDFITNLNSINSTDNISVLIKNLETFIDKQLSDNHNLIKFTNSISATSGLVTTVDSFELVNVFIPTNMVHKDSTVISSKRITVKDNGVNLSYAVWSDNLSYPNNSSASLTPENDITIAESNIYKIDGYLRITCPENTNKFVAKMLATNYNNNWSSVIYPNDKSNNLHTIIKETVRVLYDKTTNTVFMDFMLF